MENIEDKIKNILSKQLEIKKKNILNNSHFIHDLGADSLDIIELIMSFEEQFNIEITDEESENIINVKKTIDFIKNKKNSLN